MYDHSNSLNIQAHKAMDTFKKQNSQEGTVHLQQGYNRQLPSRIGGQMVK